MWLVFKYTFAAVRAAARERRELALENIALRHQVNNYTEQSHRAVKQRYYPMLGFGNFESASRFCAAFDELRQYFRVRRRGEAHVSLAEQRRFFLTRWRSLIAELATA